jgi:hypothetical protein
VDLAETVGKSEKAGSMTRSSIGASKIKGLGSPGFFDEVAE